ncbi:beta-ketoacyl-[acyl-carrier-protein] synthase family protein [Leeia sp. TBRC 13508]|uniref:Nodulation protein E n=1 Tax=Leeia speluncae TaxID=2884804 RepID=A0ABS8D3Y5_9NEIS|nr:beta-ketoacyl-[acyl-carrier-protein] synthase family protein [Leeia speluncae]MCB6182900.1 beta-ketoacyl-[acyl-carrier-protein] synthase family protein [Leeia speluncae]
MAKVLITGIGAITPIGNDANSTFASAIAGKSGIKQPDGKMHEWLPNLVVAPSENPQSLLPPAFAGLDRAAQFGLVAALEAMQQANIETPTADARRFGVFVGIGFGGAQTVDGVYDRLIAAASASKPLPVLHPLSVPRMMANAPAAALSMHFGLKGPSNTYSVACASSAIALGEAFRAIKHGYLDAAIVVGAEAMLTPGAMLAWNALRVMAKPDATDPATSCKPFSANRCGFVMGEGAGAIVLEAEHRAITRGANVIAEVAGYGYSSDAAHLTAPSSEEQIVAMEMALAEAGLHASDIQYLNAHGTATQAGDITETDSIKATFGAHTANLPVSSTKALHGHLIGASGIVEFLISVMAMNQGILPPTAHLSEPDAACDLDFIPNTARNTGALSAVMSNSFAFGGSNASLIARKYSA